MVREGPAEPPPNVAETTEGRQMRPYGMLFTALVGRGHHDRWLSSHEIARGVGERRRAYENGDSQVSHCATRLSTSPARGDALVHATDPPLGALRADFRTFATDVKVPAASLDVTSPARFLTRSISLTCQIKNG